MNVLPEKNQFATPEPFVFIKFDKNDKTNIFGDIRVAGNELFKRKRFDDAIQKYTDAINLLQDIDENVSAHEMAILYQNRAAAYEQIMNYDAGASDATKSIAANENYAKAYFRRASCNEKRQMFYCAMEDILQACILERFRTDVYNKFAMKINEKFGKNIVVVKCECR